MGRMMRCWSQFNFAIGGVWTPSSPQWSPHSTKLQSTDHAGEEQEDECDDVDEYFQGWFILYNDGDYGAQCDDVNDHADGDDED